MNQIKEVKFELPSINIGSVANLDNTIKAPVALDERKFIEHVMRRTLFSVFSRLSMIATRNPSGLIEDLKELTVDYNKLGRDHAAMWAKHVSDEMDIEGLFEHDKIMMHKICGEK